MAGSFASVSRDRTNDFDLSLLLHEGVRVSWFRVFVFWA